MLSELEIAELFDTELRVAPITSLRSLEYVLKEVQLFSTSDERRRVLQEIEQAFRPRDQDQYDTEETTLSIGVKKLLSLTEMARQDPAQAGERLVLSLTEQAMGYSALPPQRQPRRIKAEGSPNAEQAMGYSALPPQRQPRRIEAEGLPNAMDYYGV